MGAFLNKLASSYGLDLDKVAPALESELEHEGQCCARYNNAVVKKAPIESLECVMGFVSLLGEALFADLLMISKKAMARREVKLSAHGPSLTLTVILNNSNDNNNLMPGPGRGV